MEAGDSAVDKAKDAYGKATLYRTAPKTPDERADDAEMELARARRQHRAALAVVIGAALALVCSVLVGVGAQLDDLDARRRAAEQDARELGALLPTMSRLKSLCTVERERAEEQRDICAATLLGGYHVPSQSPTRLHFRDRVTGADSIVEYRWDVPTAAWRR